MSFFSPSIRSIQPGIHLFLLSLFAAMRITHSFFSDFTTALVHPNRVFFSQAVMDGVDVGKRISLFYGATFSLAVFLVVFLVIFHLLFRWGRLSVSQQQTVGYISVTGIFAVLAESMGWSSSILLSILTWLVAIRIALSICANRFPLNLRAFGTDIVFSFSAVAAVLPLSALLFLFNSATWPAEHFTLLYISLLVLILVTIVLLRHFQVAQFRKIFLFLTPLSLVPVIIFLSGELIIFTKLNHDSVFRYKLLFMGLMALGYASLVGWLWWKKPVIRMAGRKLLYRYLLPSALFAFTLFVYYNPFFSQPTELFELANPVNSILRIFAFGQIPLIDFMSSHMLWEQWSGILYSTLFGYNGTLDFMAWDFMNRVVQVFMVFWFLNHLFRVRELSFLFILAFPFLFQVFFIHLIPAILVLFTVIKAAEKPGIWQYAGIWASIIILIVWRLDTGSSALFAAFFFVPLVLFHGKVNVANAMKATGIFLIAALLAIIVASLLRSPGYIYENFMAAYHYVSANQAHGYSIITNNFHQQFYIYHLVFPVAALILIFILAGKLHQDPLKGKGFAAVSSVFFFIVYLANAQRGLVRHSFINNQDLFLASTFFLACTLAVVYFISRSQRAATPYITTYATAFLLFFALKYFPLHPQPAITENLATKNAYTGFDNYFGDAPITSRTLPDLEFQERTYSQLKAFLDENLRDDQTFFDFSNTPMLYFHCQRSVPGYFNQNLQNTVDDYLQLHLLKTINPDKVPVVVFSNEPPNWFDATDGVPNVMRYYLVAEYIFENYQPLAVINGRNIWVARDSGFQAPDGTAPSWHSAEIWYSYRYAAFFTGEYYKRKGSSYLENMWEFVTDDTHRTGPFAVPIPSGVADHKNMYIRITTDALQDHQEMVIHLKAGENPAGYFSFFTKQGESQGYMLRAGNHYSWFTLQPDHFWAENPPGVTIRKIEFLKDNRLENRNTNMD